jgi:uncharacterized protein (TIGR02117 family)
MLMPAVLKKAISILLETLLGFVLFLIFFLIAAFICSRITIGREKDNGYDIAVYIHTNGMHTDIVVPARNDQMDWSKEIKYRNTIAADTTYKYLAIGWGDKGFYLQTPTWADLKFSTAFKAVTGLSTTAIHATYYKDMPVGADCRVIYMSRPQYARLVQYITSSLQKDKDAHFVYIKTNANYGRTDAFYEANGHYSLLHTCNTWANSALKECGQKCCLWTIFDTGIFLKYEDGK